MDAEARRIIEHIPAGVAIARDGIITYVNRTMLEWFGLEGDGDSILGGNILDFVHVDDRAAAAAKLAEASAGKALQPTREYRGIHRSGGVLYLELASVPVEVGGEAAVLLLGRNVTEARAIRAQVMVADRMASLGTVAASIAHEINTPLSHVVFSLSAVAKTLERRGDGLMPDEVQRMAEQIDAARDGADRVRRIARTLRTYSRVDDSIVEVDVVDVLSSAMDLARLELRQHARLVCDFGEVRPVRANEARLGQVFVNLLVNAAHACRDSGRANAEVRLRVGVDGEHVRVEVEDTGDGMAESRVERIFEPFFTTKRGEGTGLGLWICQSIITDLGGRIEVDSEIGRGTTFRVSMPAAPP